VTFLRVLASSVEAPRERRRISPAAWVVALSILVALLGCSPSPETKPHPPTTCAWPEPACCSKPPSVGVAWLRDLRAERWGTP
jgi:hypothetical protein